MFRKPQKGEGKVRKIMKGGPGPEKKKNEKSKLYVRGKTTPNGETSKGKNRKEGNISVIEKAVGKVEYFTRGQTYQRGVNRRENKHGVSNLRPTLLGPSHPCLSIYTLVKQGKIISGDRSLG